MSMDVIERRTLYRVMENGDYPVPTNVERKLVIPVEDRQMERLGWVPAERLRGAVVLDGEALARGLSALMVANTRENREALRQALCRRGGRSDGPAQSGELPT